MCSIPNGADRVLYWATLNPTLASNYHSFFGWCQGHCECMTEVIAEEYTGETPSQQAQTNVTEDPDTIMPWHAFNATTMDAIWNGTWVNATGNVHFCAGSCSSQDECTSDDCICQVNSSTYVPRLGIVTYTSSCGSDLGKRDASGHHESLPCPCNTTYVSHSCCAAKGGVVHEPPEFKLGELDLGVER